MKLKRKLITMLFMILLSVPICLLNSTEAYAIPRHKVTVMTRECDINTGEVELVRQHVMMVDDGDTIYENYKKSGILYEYDFLGYRHGLKFDGWYLNEEGTIPFDIKNAPVTSEIVLYDKYDRFLTLNVINNTKLDFTLKDEDGNELTYEYLPININMDAYYSENLADINQYYTYKVDDIPDISSLNNYEKAPKKSYTVDSSAYIADVCKYLRISSGLADYYNKLSYDFVSFVEPPIEDALYDYSYMRRMMQDIEHYVNKTGFYQYSKIECEVVLDEVELTEAEKETLIKNGRFVEPTDKIEYAFDVKISFNYYDNDGNLVKVEQGKESDEYFNYCTMCFDDNEVNTTIIDGQEVKVNKLCVGKDNIIAVESYNHYESLDYYGLTKKIIGVNNTRMYLVSENEGPAKHYVDIVNEDNVIYETLEIYEGEKLTVPVIPVKENYEAEGWYYRDSNNNECRWDFENDTVSEDIKLYPKWVYNEGYKPSSNNTMGSGVYDPELENDNTKTSLFDKFINEIKRLAIVMSISLVGAVALLGGLLGFLILSRRAKVLNDHEYDDFSIKENFVLVDKSFVQNRDGNILASLINELLNKNEFNSWILRIPEKVVNDAVTDRFIIQLSKSFVRKHNGESLAVQLGHEEKEILITLFNEETRYSFSIEE